MAMGGVDRLTAEVGWHGMSHLMMSLHLSKLDKLR